jgi:hypothetical protein
MMKMVLGEAEMEGIGNFNSYEEPMEPVSTSGERLLRGVILVGFLAVLLLEAWLLFQVLDGWL